MIQLQIRWVWSSFCSSELNMHEFNLKSEGNKKRKMPIVNILGYLNNFIQMVTLSSNLFLITICLSLWKYADSSKETRIAKETRIFSVSKENSYIFSNFPPQQNLFEVPVLELPQTNQVYHMECHSVLLQFVLSVDETVLQSYPFANTIKLESTLSYSNL